MTTIVFIHIIFPVEYIKYSHMVLVTFGCPLCYIFLNLYEYRMVYTWYYYIDVYSMEYVVPVHSMTFSVITIC